MQHELHQHCISTTPVGCINIAFAAPPFSPLLCDWLDRFSVAGWQAAFQQDASFISERGAGIGHSALHWCAARGYCRPLAWLLRIGAPAELRNNSGSTPLHAAAANGAVAARIVSTAAKGIVSTAVIGTASTVSTVSTVSCMHC